MIVWVFGADDGLHHRNATCIRGDHAMVASVARDSEHATLHIYNRRLRWTGVPFV